MSNGTSTLLTSSKTGNCGWISDTDQMVEVLSWALLDGVAGLIAPLSSSYCCASPPSGTKSGSSSATMFILLYEKYKYIMCVCVRASVDLCACIFMVRTLVFILVKYPTKT